MDSIPKMKPISNLKSIVIESGSLEKDRRAAIKELQEARLKVTQKRKMESELFKKQLYDDSVLSDVKRIKAHTDTVKEPPRLSSLPESSPRRSDSKEIPKSADNVRETSAAFNPLSSVPLSTQIRDPEPIRSVSLIVFRF